MLPGNCRQGQPAGLTVSLQSLKHVGLLPLVVSQSRNALARHVEVLRIALDTDAPVTHRFRRGKRRTRAAEMRAETAIPFSRPTAASRRNRCVRIGVTPEFIARYRIRGDPVQEFIPRSVGVPLSTGPAPSRFRPRPLSRPGDDAGPHDRLPLPGCRSDVRRNGVTPTCSGHWPCDQNLPSHATRSGVSGPSLTLAGSRQWSSP